MVNADDRTSPRLIDGRKAADDIQKELKLEIAEWTQNGNLRPPSLVAIQVGDDPASTTYISKKMSAAQYVGITSETRQLPPTATESEIIELINQLNADATVDGILVQLPVPAHVSERNVCDAVDPRKDVDGFNCLNMGKLAINVSTIIPATVLAVIELLKREKIETFGKNVVICGRSKNIGLPLMMLLHSDARNQCPGYEATVTLCHRNTPPEQLSIFTKSADIIISATGVVNLIRKEMVKPGVCVIDVGLTRIKTGDGNKTKLVGDVDFQGVGEVAGSITPVPGGVGPMTVAMLMKNTFSVAKSLRNHSGGAI